MAKFALKFSELQNVLCKICFVLLQIAELQILQRKLQDLKVVLKFQAHTIFQHHKT